MGRKKIDLDQKKVAVTIHLEKHKIDVIGVDVLKSKLLIEAERLFKND